MSRCITSPTWSTFTFTFTRQLYKHLRSTLVSVLLIVLCHIFRKDILEYKATSRWFGLALNRSDDMRRIWNGLGSYLCNTYLTTCNSSVWVYIIPFDNFLVEMKIVLTITSLPCLTFTSTFALIINTQFNHLTCEERNQSPNTADCALSVHSSTCVYYPLYGVTISW